MPPAVLAAILESLQVAGALAGVGALVKDLAEELWKKRGFQKQFQQALENARQRFIATAQQRGWRDLALQFLKDPSFLQTPAFQEALKAALGAGDPQALEAALRKQLAGLPGVDDLALAAQAARLYASQVLDELWQVEALRGAVRDVLFKGQVDALRRLEDALARMRAELPRQVAVEVWEEKARRDARTAWKAVTPPTLPPTTPGAPFSFHELKAPYRFVPFTGQSRLALRNELVAWAEDVAQRPHRSGLRWLWGPGGAGKTRLMVEVARVLQERGWRVGFLPREVWEKAHFPHWARPDRPALLVADYAELRNPDQVTGLLEAVVQAAEERPYPLALVLLTRQGPEPGDAATSAGLLAETLRTWSTRGTEPLRERLVQEALNQALGLPALTDAERAELFRAAVERFRERLAVAPETPTVDYPADALPRHPLPLILLALLAAYGHRVAQSRDERAVYEAAWAWERGKWDDALRGAGLWPAEHDLRREALERVEQALVAATLGRVFRDARDVAAFWEQMAHGEGLLEPRDLRRLAAQPPRLFPLVEEAAALVPPIAPDPLADFVLARRPDLPALTRAALPTPEDVHRADQAAVQRAKGGQTVKVTAEDPELGPLAWPQKTLGLIPRLMDAYPEAGRKVARELAGWLEATARALHKRDADAAARWLERWEAALPDHPERTVALREVLAGYCRGRLALVATDEDRAQWMHNLGVALSALGRHKEALQATKKAVDIYRDLAQCHPDRFLPDQAMSLTGLGAVLSALGRHEEALKATQEAVDLYRDLAQHHPDRFRPDLARSLTGLGAVLSALGRHEEALQATKEAVAIRRKLADQHPDRFLPDLATSLNNLGNRLSALGRHAEALAATKEAVEHYRQLAQRHPDRFLPDLAMALNNLGNRLSALGRHEEALQATKEAVAIYRDLAQRHPDRFLPDLATSLHNLGVDLSVLGRHEEALQATQEAVAIRRRLAQRHPDRFLPDLARNLNNLGIWLSALGRHEEALQATQEAVDIRRRLAQRHPDRFLPDLARSLHNLGNRLSALGRHEEALQATKEAVALYRDLAQRYPDRFLPELARSLGARGAALLRASRPAEAAEAFAEGLRALLPFARRLPRAFGPLLAALLDYYLRAAQAAGREPDAALVEEVAKALLGVPQMLEVPLEQAVQALPKEIRRLLAGVALAVRGQASPEQQSLLEEALAQLAKSTAWGQLAQALQRLLAGQREHEALTQGLNLDIADALALTLTLAALEEDAVLALLADGTEK